jgi:hypothetical protein
MNIYSYIISRRLSRKNGNPKIADIKQDGIPGHEPNLWIWYRVPGIPDFTPIFDLIREERILSAILGVTC